MREESRVSVESDLDAPWTSLPWPVLVVDRAGAIQSISDSARSVLPEATAGTSIEDVTPSWLSRAHRDFTAKSPAIAGVIDGRGFDAHPAMLAGGEVAWCLVEDTARVLQETQQSLTKERERTAFLAEASAVLGASLNIDRCMEAGSCRSPARSSA